MLVATEQQPCAKVIEGREPLLVILRNSGGHRGYWGGSELLRSDLDKAGTFAAKFLFISWGLMRKGEVHPDG